MSGNLNDKKFVAQTINYANNDGVLWCVLANGLGYRVYKTNEPVAMEQKMLLKLTRLVMVYQCQKWPSC